MKKTFLILAAATMFLVACYKDDPTPTPIPTPAVYLTQIHTFDLRSNGDTIMTFGEDFVWENGLLKSTHYVHALCRKPRYR